MRYRSFLGVFFMREIRERVSWVFIRSGFVLRVFFVVILVYFKIIL